MAARFTRRDVISTTAAGVVAAAWPRFAAGQNAGLKLTDLGAELVLVEGAGANVVALAVADGLLLVDGGAEAHVAALQHALAQRWPGRPVEVAFNTNWRGEHTGANAALRGAGAAAPIRPRPKRCRACSRRPLPAERTSLEGSSMPPFARHRAGWLVN